MYFKSSFELRIVEVDGASIATIASPILLQHPSLALSGFVKRTLIPSEIYFNFGKS